MEIFELLMALLCMAPLNHAMITIGPIRRD